jgi:PAS domain S-box-containing protein
MDEGQEASILPKQKSRSAQPGTNGKLSALAGIAFARNETHPALRPTSRGPRQAGQEFQRPGQAVADIKTRYQLLVNSVTDYALYMLDREGCVVTWNAGAERLKGYTAEEILGRNYSLFFLPEDVKAGAPARALEEASRDGRYDVEAWRLRKDGTKFWAMITLTTIRGPRGELRGFAKVTRDITVRKIAEDAMRSRNAELERYRTIVENVDEYAIFALDTEGRFLNWCAAAEKNSGYTAEEMVGRTYASIATEEDRLAGLPQQELEEAARTGRCVRDSWKVRKDGSRLWSIGVVTAVRDETGKLTGYIRIARDMTQYKQLQDVQARLAAELEDRVQERTMQLEANMAELRRKNAEVEASAQTLARELKEKRVLFGEIHHRVKNNLQVVQSLLKMQVRALPESEARAAIETTILRVRSMATVHERLYQMPNLADLPVAEFLRDIFNGVIASYSVRPGRIKFRVDAEEIRLTLEKAVPFGLLANELLSNSLKHAFPTDKKGTVSVSVHREGDAVRMIVEDNGVGLPADFDAGTSKSMGLKLAQSLAHQLGGALQFTSGHGCHIDAVFTRL